MALVHAWPNMAQMNTYVALPALMRRSAHQHGGEHVDGQAERRPPADDDWEDARPDGDQGDDDECRRAQGAHHVRPHARAVQQLHAELRRREQQNQTRSHGTQETRCQCLTLAIILVGACTHAEASADTLTMARHRKLLARHQACILSYRWLALLPLLNNY